MNKAKMPLVSIITPAYNREPYIERTIRSVLNQDYPNIEYIVINDGSKDKTLNIIKKYSSKIKLLSHANKGEQKTVNKGMKIAKGEIICILNSDDILFPNAVSEAVSTFHKHPSVLITYSDWVKIDKNDRVKEKIITKNYSFEHLVKRHDCLPGVGSFFKKALLSQLKGRDESFTYVSDYDFWLRAGLLGQFIRIPYFLAAFREHPDSTTIKKAGEKMAKEHVHVVDKFYKYQNIPSEIMGIKKQAYASAYIVAGICSKNNYKKKYSYFLTSFKLYPWYIIKKLIKKIMITPFVQLYMLSYKETVSGISY